jgi:hypothetical protein
MVMVAVLDKNALLVLGGCGCGCGCGCGLLVFVGASFLLGCLRLLGTVSSKMAHH